MRARRDISENDLLEIAACNPVEVEKHVEAVLRKVLKNGQRPRKIGPPIAEEDGFSMRSMRPMTCERTEWNDTRNPAVSLL